MSKTFSDLLRARAAAKPDAVAVIDETGATSFAELDVRVDAAAAEIAASGARRVAIIASNSTAFLVRAFGAWRAGCTLVTVYPSSPAAEIDYALRHADADLVFADVECLERVPGDFLARDIAFAPPASVFSETPVDVEAAALICFTSGSTQRPKAVVHSHRSVLAGAESYAQVWHLSEQDTTLVVLPMAWAFGLVTTSMAALSAGGAVRSVRRARPDSVIPALVGDGVTFFAGVTTIFAKLVATIEDGAALAGHRVRLCISGGEPRNERVFDAWQAATGVPVHDVYAASECFPVVTYDPIADPAPVPGCAGRVVQGSELRLWNETDEEWVEGAGVGEAFVKGGAFFTEYLGDPETTRAVLTDDGWYRTGDLVELRPDGLVRVLGRLSGMIIRGGANVAPAEIERVVRDSGDVADAVAIGLPDERFGQRVVVAVTLAAGARTGTAEILERCREHLAGYKVPDQVIIVDELPLNDRTGKIDRRRVEAQLIGAAA